MNVGKLWLLDNDPHYKSEVMFSETMNLTCIIQVSLSSRFLMTASMFAWLDTQKTDVIPKNQVKSFKDRYPK